MNRITEEQMTPMKSVEWDGSRLSDLISIRSKAEREIETQTAMKIDRALTDYQELTGGMEPENWKLLRMLLMGHLL